MYTHTHMYMGIHVYINMYVFTHILQAPQLRVFFEKKSYLCRALLQKSPGIFGSLLVNATPQK